MISVLSTRGFLLAFSVSDGEPARFNPVGYEEIHKKKNSQRSGVKNKVAKEISAVWCIHVERSLPRLHIPCLVKLLTADWELQSYLMTSLPQQLTSQWQCLH